MQKMEYSEIKSNKICEDLYEENYRTVKKSKNQINGSIPMFINRQILYCQDKYSYLLIYRFN